MPKRAVEADQVDLVFRALADPTRRQVVERLASGPASTSELAEPFAMALPSFTEHLAVLRWAGLVVSDKQGRTRTYRLAPSGLDAVEGWLAGQRRMWQQRLDQLDQFLVDQNGVTVSFTPHPVNPDLDLELVRDVPVPPKAVFEAWTDPASIKQWFAPRPYSIPLCEIDLRPGGGFRTVMNDPDGEQVMDSTGCYLEITPNERLVWTSALTTDYRPQSGDMPFTAILELTDNGSGGCTYRAIAVHQDPDDAKKHAAMGFHDGWGTVVDQLVEHIRAK